MSMQLDFVTSLFVSGVATEVNDILLLSHASSSRRAFADIPYQAAGSFAIDSRDPTMRN